MSTLYNDMIRKLLLGFLVIMSFNVFAKSSTISVLDTIQFVLYFNETIGKADNDGYIHAVVDGYGLEIVNSYDISTDFRAIVAIASNDIYMPLDLAKELSFIDGVLMVKLENIVANKQEI
ncbi:MAG: hypothetical protein MK207_12330 [Saprospiraceae bacterium]|nr:hypothetical protein [Saprospiraceae bacterium]